MTILAWVLVTALVLVTVFAAANWSLLTAPASLNFLLFTVEGPLGLILFGSVVVFAALFALYALSLRTKSLVETRRHLKDLEAQRRLADNAEASRLAGLDTRINQEFSALRAELQAVRAELATRGDATEQRLRTHMDETANSLFASVGQVDDKLERMEGSTRRP